MTTPLSLIVLTPEKKLLETEVKSVQVLLSDGGRMGILPGHTKLIAATASGDLTYLDLQDNLLKIELGDGILSVENNCVRVMTNPLLEENQSESEDGNPFDRITREIIQRLKMNSQDR